jgi:hypothetical protein
MKYADKYRNYDAGSQCRLGKYPPHKTPQRVATLKNLKSNIDFDLLNTILVTT